MDTLCFDCGSTEKLVKISDDVALCERCHAEAEEHKLLWEMERLEMEAESAMYIFGWALLFMVMGILFTILVWG